MNEPSLLSKPGAIAIVALAACGYVGGWLVLLVGGFHHASSRYSAQTSFVSGAPAMAVAAVFFALAAVGVIALFKMRGMAWKWQFIGSCAVLLPPLCFTFAG